MSVATLTAQRERLLRLQVDVDQQLAAVEAALRMWVPRPGRPRIPLTLTIDEARRAKAAYKRGDRSEWAVMGRREYERHLARRRVA